MWTALRCQLWLIHRRTSSPNLWLVGVMLASLLIITCQLTNVAMPHLATVPGHLRTKRSRLPPVKPPTTSAVPSPVRSSAFARCCSICSSVIFSKPHKKAVWDWTLTHDARRTTHGLSVSDRLSWNKQTMVGQGLRYCNNLADGPWKIRIIRESWEWIIISCHGKLIYIMGRAYQPVNRFCKIRHRNLLPRYS